MRILSAVLAIAVSVSVITPTFARGFGGGGFGGFRGGGGGWGGGGHGWGGGGGGFHFGGGGGHDWGGGGRDWGGGGGGFHFGGDHDHDWGGGGGFGGHSSGDYGGGFNNIARPSDRSNFTNNFGNHPFGGDGDWSNRPGGGNHPLDPNGGWGNHGNHPLNPNLNPNHPTDGGWGHLSNWNQHQNDFHSFKNNDWNTNSIRNSFNHTTNVNVNNWGGGGWGHWGGWGGGGWWGFPGGWYCPGWSAAFAWTSFGISTFTDFLGLAMMADMAEGGGGHGGGGGSGSGGNYPSVTNVTYQGPNVYINGQPAGTSQSYYDENQQLANIGVQYATTHEQQSASSSDQWKPFGVFSLAQPGQTQSTMLFQLAINKEGIVRGNYFNQLTNESSEVFGSLNKKTQMVSFTLGQNSSTIFDTRLADLTKEDAPVLVHYGPNSTQPMMLVRLKQPPNMGTTASNSPS